MAFQCPISADVLADALPDSAAAGTPVEGRSGRYPLPYMVAWGLAMGSWGRPSPGR
jgi:putative membrane protein